MNTTRLGIALVFVTGCAVGGASARLAIPPASAQQAATLTKWEFKCQSLDNDDLSEFANKMGDQGWEIAGSARATTYDDNIWCFRRPKL